MQDACKKNWRRSQRHLEINYSEILKKHTINDESQLSGEQTKYALLKFQHNYDLRAYFDDTFDGTISYTESAKFRIDKALFQSPQGAKRLAFFKPFGVIIGWVGGALQFAIVKKAGSIEEQHFEYFLTLNLVNRLAVRVLTEKNINPEQVFEYEIDYKDSYSQTLKNSIKTVSNEHNNAKELIIDSDTEYFVCHILDDSVFKFLMGPDARTIMLGKSAFEFKAAKGLRCLKDMYPKYKKTVLLPQDCTQDKMGITGSILFGLSQCNQKLSASALAFHQNRASSLNAPGGQKISGLKLSEQMVQEVQKKFLALLNNLLKKR